jgi:thiopurine S-methyltransferase
LCGKSADLLWLAGRGYDVVGVELSEVAARSFLSENNLDATVVEEPPFRVFCAGRIRFHVGDFFDLAPGRVGQFQLVYDRAALIALPPDLRPVYARTLQSLMAPGASMLLISLEYDPKEMEGPPFQVPESEVRALFDGRHVEKLHEHDCLDEEPHFRQRGLTRMREAVYRL